MPYDAEDDQDKEVALHLYGNLVNIVLQMLTARGGSTNECGGAHQLARIGTRSLMRQLFA